jgi:surface protein
MSFILKSLQRIPGGYAPTLSTYFTYVFSTQCAGHHQATASTAEVKNKCRRLKLEKNQITSFMKKFILIVSIYLLSVIQSFAQFTTIWKTDIRGISANDQILIPAFGSGYSIVWENVSNPSIKGSIKASGNYTLQLPVPGTYRVHITKGTGTFNAFRFNNTGDRPKLLEITNWGDSQWTTMAGAFYGCENLVISATDIPDLSNVTDFSYMFSSCMSVSRVPNINSWDVSNATDMSYMFRYALKFNEAINEWDVSGVTDMSSMFYVASAFNQPLNNWDVSHVTNMQNMFTQAHAFNQSLNEWDVSGVTDMSYMFYGAVVFNQALNNWDVSHVTNMKNMFFTARAFNQPLNKWNVGRVTNMNGMLYLASAFNQPINNWDVSQVTDMSYMFYSTVFNQPLNNWDVSQVTNMSFMFYSASAFNRSIKNWDVSRVTNISGMFMDTRAFNRPLNNWNVGKVTDMSYMFYSASAFNQPLESWNLTGTLNMSRMFDNAAIDCQNLSQTLQGWANNPQTPDNITFSASDRDYAAQANDALTTLRTDKNWTIQIGSEVECGVLPVTLVRFTARSEFGRVNLSWETAWETDHDYFEVERSDATLNWIPIARIQGAGTAASTQNYTHIDDAPLAGSGYYRLKIVDLAGKVEFSQVRSVSIKNSEKQKAYPNPANSIITITGQPQGLLKIYNTKGLEVLRRYVSGEKTDIPVRELPTGTYILKMDNGWRSTLIKN